MLCAGTQDPAQEIPEMRVRSGPYSPAPPTFAAQTNLVELGVTVKNHQWQPVGGLTADRFELADNGKPQVISFFSEQKAPRAESPTSEKKPADASVPVRSIVLFFDDMHADDMTLPKSRDAARKFLTGGVLPGDRIAIFTSSGTPAVDFTSDTKSLLAVLDQLKAHPEEGRGFSDCPRLNPYQAYAIFQHLDLELKQWKVAEAIRCNCGPQPELVCIQAQDFVVQDAADTAWHAFKPTSIAVIERIGSVIHYLANAPGSRVLLLISPGFPAGGLEQKISGVMDAAIKARIVINSLNSRGLTAYRMQGRETLVLGEVMANASLATGGQYLQNDNDLSTGIRGLAEPEALSYILGFSPTAEPDDKYHRLKVKLKDDSGFHVEARPGYFPVKETEKPADTVQQRIDRLAASKDTVEDFPASVHVSGSEKEGTTVIEVDISVTASSLKFADQGERHIQQLTFVTLILDAAGNVVAGKQSVVDYALKPAKLAEFQSKGIEATTSFHLPKGAYQVREVIREAMENRMAASNAPIAVW